MNPDMSRKLRFISSTPAIISLAFAFLLLLGSCARKGSEELEEANPVIGVIRSTTHEYTLHSGSDGTLYTVRDLAGTLIASEVSREYLAKHHPERSEELSGIWAGNRRWEASPSSIESADSLPAPDGLLPKLVPPSPARP